MMMRKTKISGVGVWGLWGYRKKDMYRVRPKASVQLSVHCKISGAS